MPATFPNRQSWSLICSALARNIHASNQCDELGKRETGRVRGAARVFKNCLRFHMANDDEGGKGRNCNKTPVNPTAKLARRSVAPSARAPRWAGPHWIPQQRGSVGHPPGEECRKIIAFFGLGGGKSKQTERERGREEGSRRRLSIVVTLQHTCFSGT